MDWGAQRPHRAVVQVYYCSNVDVKVLQSENVPIDAKYVVEKGKKLFECN